MSVIDATVSLAGSSGIVGLTVLWYIGVNSGYVPRTEYRSNSAVTEESRLQALHQRQEAQLPNHCLTAFPVVAASGIDAPRTAAELHSLVQVQLAVTPDIKERFDWATRVRVAKADAAAVSRRDFRVGQVQPINDMPSIGGIITEDHVVTAFSMLLLA